MSIASGVLRVRVLVAMPSPSAVQKERAYLRDIERMLGQSVPPQLDHEYHDNASMLSTLPAPPNFGKGATSGEKRGRGRNTPRDTGAGFGERRKAAPGF